MKVYTSRTILAAVHGVPPTNQTFVRSELGKEGDVLVKVV
jgi:hypothetical protein